MNSGPTISIGATGHDVRRLQRIFVMTKVLAPSNITGTFDSTTEQAVKDFQQGAGLTVDGIVGPITWQALPADPNTPLLARGASGSVVTALQKGLKKYSTPATDPGAVDGDFRAEDRSRCQSLPTGSGCPGGRNRRRPDVVGSGRRRGGYSCVAVGTYDGVI